ncbi:MAG: type II toxin-antitoxin system RelE/ParE family toxin [Patescibacteria group bacterium]
MYVFYHKQFEKKFRLLPLKIKNKFYERLELFIENQFAEVLNNHSVEKFFPDCRSINISGDYRAILKENNDVIIFITIGTHAELY